MTCENCGGSGWLFAYHDNDPSLQSAFICPCRAKAYAPDAKVRFWASHFENDGWHKIGCTFAMLRIYWDVVKAHRERKAAAARAT